MWAAPRSLDAPPQGHDHIPWLHAVLPVRPPSPPPPPPCCGCSTFCLCLRPVSVRPLVKTSFSLQNLTPFLSRALSTWPCAVQSSGGSGEAAVLRAALAFPAPAPDGTAHPGRALGDGLTDEWAASEAAGRLKTLTKPSAVRTQTRAATRRCGSDVMSPGQAKRTTHSSTEFGFVIHCSLCRKRFKVRQVQVNL